MTEELDVISWLARWPGRHCGGPCDHEYHARIDSVAGPEWRVVIELGSTDMAADVFGAIAIDRSPEDWLRCEIREGKFVGTCGPANLIELLERFRSWVAARGRMGA